MWFIKFLSGPLAGKSLPLKPGRNVVGRAPHCDVVIPSQNISKEHVTVEVYNDKIIVTDLNSRNGTFINGVQIKSQKLAPDDKLGFFDILVEIKMRTPSKKNQLAPIRLHRDSSGAAKTSGAANMSAVASMTSASHGQVSHGALAYNQHPDAAAQPQAQGQAYLKNYVLKYLEEVVLPGAYKLNEWLDFHQVIALFVAVFIVFVTTLSTVPLMRILKSSIEKEAQNRAQTIARALVRENMAPISQGLNSLVSTDNATHEAGVNKAYIISNYSGDIIAPIQLQGQHLTDVPFVHEARKTNQESVHQIDDNTIVAIAPIGYYKSDTGTNSVPAHAVVVYNMGALAVDKGRTISLFVQVLFIAMLLGGVLYYFLYKVILKPITELNRQVDSALRAGHGQISIPYRFPELQTLATNINSAISRSGGGFGSEQIPNFEQDRSQEMQNVVNLVGFPALSINSDKVIMGINAHFTSQIGMQGQWLNTPIQSILDQALKLNLQSLMDTLLANPSSVAHEQLEIANLYYDISAQAIMGNKNVAYAIVVFVPRSGDAT